MRSVLFRFPDPRALERRIAHADGGDLDLEWSLASPGRDGDPPAAPTDGEWILVVLEVGEHRRATSAAAHVDVSPDGIRVLLEPRDCRRIQAFLRDEATRPTGPADRATSGDEAAAPQRGSSPSAAPPTVIEPAPDTARSVAPPPSPNDTSRDRSDGRGSFTGEANPGRAPHIVLVDDDAEVREMVVAMLEAVELRVTPVGSAEEAMILARSAAADAPAFDLLVLDWNLPKMSGLDLCRQFRREPRLATLPVLFLTANASPQDMIEAFACGADDYVVKPFRAPELGARIFALLRRARMARGAWGKSASASA